MGLKNTLGIWLESGKILQIHQTHLLAHAKFVPRYHAFWTRWAWPNFSLQILVPCELTRSSSMVLCSCNEKYVVRVYHPSKLLPIRFDIRRQDGGGGGPLHPACRDAHHVVVPCRWAAGPHPSITVTTKYRSRCKTLFCKSVYSGTVWHRHCIRASWLTWDYTCITNQVLSYYVTENARDYVVTHHYGHGLFVCGGGCRSNK